MFSSSTNVRNLQTREHRGINIIPNFVNRCDQAKAKPRCISTELRGAITMDEWNDIPISPDEWEQITIDECTKKGIPISDSLL